MPKRGDRARGQDLVQNVVGHGVQRIAALAQAARREGTEAGKRDEARCRVHRRAALLAVLLHLDAEVQALLRIDILATCPDCPRPAEPDSAHS